MAIFRTVKNKNYTIIHNGFLTDNNLSLKAKGLLAYFLSKPDDWNFYTNEIAQNCKDGKDSISTAIKELMDLGYIERFKRRDDKGKFNGGFDYLVYETPNSGKPIMVKPDLEKPNMENPDLENSNSGSPDSENPPLLNTESKLNTKYKQNTKTPPITEYKENTKILQGSKDKENIEVLRAASHKQDIKKTEKNTKAKGWCSNSDIYEFYLNNGFGKLNKVVKELLDNAIDKYSKEAVKQAMIESIKNNKYTLSYVEGILKNKAKKLKENKAEKYKESKGGVKVGDGISNYEEDLRRKGLILDLDDL